jgi:hypothetical protein
MKNLFLICALIASLNAQTMEEPKVTPLEMFLFKIGFTSLVEDVNAQKSVSKVNGEDIKVLKTDIKYILQKMNKNKLEETNNVVINSNDNSSKDISSLKDEVKKLKEEIKLLKQQKIVKNKQVDKIKDIVKSTEKIRKVEIIKAKVKIKNANVLDTPNKNSAVIRALKLNEVVFIDFCNRNGWCKIEKKWDYIAKASLKFYTQNTDIKNSNFKARVSLPKAFIVSQNSPDSEVIKEVKQDDILDIKYCDKYGWCKLTGDGYIGKWKISIDN